MQGFAKDAFGAKILSMYDEAKENNYILKLDEEQIRELKSLYIDLYIPMEKLGHFDREVIPERRMHAKGSGAYGTFTVTHDITQYTRASIFSEVGKKTDCFVRFSTVAGERGAADAERDIRGFAMKFYTETGNWGRGYPAYR